MPRLPQLFVEPGRVRDSRCTLVNRQPLSIILWCSSRSKPDQTGGHQLQECTSRDRPNCFRAPWAPGGIGRVFVQTPVGHKNLSPNWHSRRYATSCLVYEVTLNDIEDVHQSKLVTRAGCHGSPLILVSATHTHQSVPVFSARVAFLLVPADGFRSTHLVQRYTVAVCIQQLPLAELRLRDGKGTVPSGRLVFFQTCRAASETHSRATSTRGSARLQSSPRVWRQECRLRQGTPACPEPSDAW